MLTQLLMLQHSDAAFPSGGFAFSNGVEGLAALGESLTPASLTNVLIAALRGRWAGADRVALIAAFRAYQNYDSLAAIDAAFEAATLAEPMRAGSKRNGQSLLAAHARLGAPGAEALRVMSREGRIHGHLPVVQGALWRALGVTEKEAALMAGYQTASGMTAAAVRLGQIGAIEAQRSLSSVLHVIAEIVQQPTGEAERPGDAFTFTSFIPFIEIAALRHASADLRLFAN